MEYSHHPASDALSLPFAMNNQLAMALCRLPFIVLGGCLITLIVSEIVIGGTDVFLYLVFGLSCIPIIIGSLSIYSSRVVVDDNGIRVYTQRALRKEKLHRFMRWEKVKYIYRMKAPGFLYGDFLICIHCKDSAMNWAFDEAHGKDSITKFFKVLQQIGKEKNIPVDTDVIVKDRVTRQRKLVANLGKVVGMFGLTLSLLFIFMGIGRNGLSNVQVGKYAVIGIDIAIAILCVAILMKSFAASNRIESESVIVPTTNPFSPNLSDPTSKHK